MTPERTTRRRTSTNFRVSESPAPLDRALDRYEDVRRFSMALCEGLEPEDLVVQSMADVSPTRWHLAHTTWFFETFVLSEHVSGYRRFHPQFDVLFNSYYEQVGPQHPRPERGRLSRPTVREILAYRESVDHSMRSLGEVLGHDSAKRVAPILELGLQHEQQHQELMLTDLKHVFSCNPLAPSYREGGRLTAPELREGPWLDSERGAEAAGVSRATAETGDAEPARFVEFEGGIHEIGHAGEGFAYDHEGPRHEVLLRDYALADRAVTNAEFAEFVADGGYERSDLWLSAGWDRVRSEGWSAPLYWRRIEDRWFEFTLDGLRPLRGDEPVTHVSYFEADAFARWAGCRLPAEAEWEVAAAGRPVEGNFADGPDAPLHPKAVSREERGSDDGNAGDATHELHGLYGDVWEWTASPYVAYPGYRPPAGAIGEYNGKFMCNQFVLRGGSCASSRSHLRTTYRNFFPPEARWQFTGIRLARD